MKKEGSNPASHPTLAALSIVLTRNGDLGSINRFHPDLNEHEFYDAEAMFPSDLSNLLPPVEEHWWESLGESYLLNCPHTYIFI